MKNVMKSWFLLIPLILGINSGCNSRVQTVPSEENPVFGPHGGPLVSLPEGQGMVEIALEPVKSGFRLVAYFYANAEMNSPLTPDPTQVRIELKEPGGGSFETILSPETQAGISKFVSSVGDFEIDPLIGTIYANFGGQPASFSFSGGIR
jgi:hypothetical protein